MRFRHLFLFLLLIGELWGQGPNTAYYYNPQTELSWARCTLYLEGGSQLKIPFLPVVSGNFQRAPLGTHNYSKDIDVDSRLVFIGNGIFLDDQVNCYFGRRSDYTLGKIDISGRVVLFCYDFPDKIEEQYGKNAPLKKRIVDAELRGASAVILFSFEKKDPFLMISFDNESDIPKIPVITIAKETAIHILQSAGYDSETFIREWHESGKPPGSSVLISRILLQIESDFEKIETENFLFRFRKEVIPYNSMQEIAEVNEKALRFLLRLFKGDGELRWEKLFAVYFKDYDTKLFFTHHWGSGLASGEGIFIVHKGKVPDFALAVHENAHILAHINWGGSTSFLNEGVGKYAEAMASDKNKNHLQTLRFMEEKKLFPLEDMLDFQIGRTGLKTDVGYPAAGSFVGFLIEKYGLRAFKEVFALENRTKKERENADSWNAAYGKSLHDLEKEWHRWLTDRNDLNH
jgi:hypothetical protein